MRTGAPAGHQGHFHEAAFNNTDEEFLAIATANTIATNRRTHPHLGTVDGRHVPDLRYQEPADFLAQRPAGDVDPLEATTPPVVDLLDPTPAAARNAARGFTIRLVIRSGTTEEDGHVRQPA
jgi:hypothetical protein